MYKLIRFSVTMYTPKYKPTTGHKYKYVFENEKGEKRIRTLYTDIDKCFDTVNRIVVRPFLTDFTTFSFIPCTHINSCYTKITCRLDYKQRK